MGNMAQDWALVGTPQAVALVMNLLCNADRVPGEAGPYYQCPWDLQMQLLWGFVSGLGVEAASEVCDTLA